MKWVVTNKRRNCKPAGVYTIEKISSIDCGCYTIDASSVSITSTVGVSSSVTDRFDELEKKIKALEAKIKILESGRSLP